MMRIGLHTGALALLVAGALAAGLMLGENPAWAASTDKQETKGKGKGKGKAADGDKSSAREPARSAGTIERHFVDQHRVVIRNYYAAEFNSGRCPPGLAKKSNGCMPPGQAKKWQIGRPLPREVIFHDLPRSILVELGPPPAGHRFVRVAADILLIAIGTGMVIDAIEDLGRM